MCCAIYYVYLKCKKYFKECSKQRKEREELKAEALYTARMLDEYVKNKKKTYWTHYDQKNEHTMGL